MVNLWGFKDGRALHKRLVRKWEQWTRKWEPLVPDSMSGAVTGMVIPVSGGVLTLFLVWGLLRTLHNRTIYADAHPGSESKQLATLLAHGADQSSNLAGEVELGRSESQVVERTTSGAGTKRPAPDDDLLLEDGNTEPNAEKVDKSKKKKLKQKKSKKKSGHRKERDGELGEPGETSGSSEKKKTSGKGGRRKGKGKRGKSVQRERGSSRSSVDKDAGNVVQEDTDVSEDLG